MQPISEKTGAIAGAVPNRFGALHDEASIGIDLVQVAESHVLLFGRVKDFVHGAFHDAQAVMADLEQDCELDRWLQGIGATRFGQLRAFDRLHEAHAEFHRQAAKVLGEIHAGSWVAAEHMRKSELSQALRRVLITLADLNDSIGRQADIS